MTTARLLAVSAVAAGALAFAWVVISSLDGGGSSSAETAETGTSAEEACNPKADAALDAGYYTIKEGDLLSLIAERTCMTEQDLVRLNPGVDPQTLTPGACLSLAEDGCERLEDSVSGEAVSGEVPADSATGAVEEQTAAPPGEPVP